MSDNSLSFFDLLRHGQIDGPAALYGKTDVALSELGWRNLQLQMSVIQRPHQIISSPLKRCRAFAEYCGQQWQVPVLIEDDLRECDFGKFDGIPFDALQQQWPLLEAFWQQPAEQGLPGAESLIEFHQRVATCWQQIVSRYSRQRTLLVCHGGVIRQILGQLLPVNWQSGEWYSQLHIDYASLTKISIAPYENAKPVVQSIGQLAPAEDKSS